MIPRKIKNKNINCTFKKYGEKMKNVRLKDSAVCYSQQLMFCDYFISLCFVIDACPVLSFAENYNICYYYNMVGAILKLVFGHMLTVNGPYQTAQISDHGLHCLLTESLYRHYRIMSGEQRPGCYFAHVQDDLNLQRFDGTFSLDMVCM